ncbi:phosphate-regulating neutral endopeptidase PHEX-like [Ciona intestinalis]
MLRKPVIIFALLVIIALILFICLFVLAYLGVIGHRKICNTPECAEISAYYRKNINFDVDPCEDFFEFSCGKWIRENPIPDDATKLETYSILRDNVINRLREILEEKGNTTNDASLNIAKDLYNSCVDIGRIEELGTQPLLEFLVGNLTWPIISKNWCDGDYDEIGTLTTLQGSYSNSILVNLYVHVDDDNTTYYVLKLNQGSLMMKDVYYEEDEQYTKFQDALKTFMIDSALLIAENSDLDLSAEEIASNMTEAFNFEMKLANIKVNSENDSHTIMTIEELTAEVPGLDWLRIVNEIVRDNITSPNRTLSVYSLQYFKDLVPLLAKTPSRVKQNYMVWRIVKNRIGNLGLDFQNMGLEYIKVFSGQLKLRDRRSDCVDYVKQIFPGPTGYMFISKYFKEEDKQAVLNMVKRLKSSFKWLLANEVQWMDEATKELALEKCDFIQPNIGYSPYYQNTTAISEAIAVTIDPKDYFGNVVRILEFSAQTDWVYINKAVEKSSWNVPPTTVNAYYSPIRNAIMFPAGELQAPFYWGNKYPMSVQFGGIGTIIGHELTHAFDTVGGSYDKFGNLYNWWSNQSYEAFMDKTECLVNQYNEFYWDTAESNLDGKNTLPENIADNGAIRQSFLAYKDWVAEMGEEKLLPGIGFNNEQMFFLGYANVRCGHYKTKRAQYDIKADVHSPGKFRILGPLINFEKFATVFNCPAGSKMVKKADAEKCIIW